jgi:hypothetical protein
VTPRWHPQDLLDPDSEVVQEALKHRCPLCEAPVGEGCRPSPLPLRGRHIHLCRVVWR